MTDHYEDFLDALEQWRQAVRAMEASIDAVQPEASTTLNEAESHARICAKLAEEHKGAAHHAGHCPSGMARSGRDDRTPQPCEGRPRMTQDKVTVTQADRDAAAEYWQTFVARVGEVIVGNQMRKGGLDELESVQAFARHREAAEAEARKREAVLQQALVNHNDVLRSAYQIAARKGEQTEWEGFTLRAGSVLHFHHDEVNDARAAIAKATGEGK